MDDDLDIYDDLDEFQETEQKKSKELQEWETKFANAQVEINNYQAQNKALAKKIKTMEVNFQNLLDTAKAEIKRKDTMIAQLRKEKDDICFRRKAPKGVPKRTKENQQLAPQLFKPDETVVASDVNKIEKQPNKFEKDVKNPFKQDSRQEPKRLKLEDTVVTSDVINKTDKRHKEIAADEQKTQEIVQEKKTDHKRGRQSSSEAKSSQERSSLDTKRLHDRDRDRDRNRDRNQSRSRRRSRSQSRSRSRERGRSRHVDEQRNSRSKESQRSRRSRSRSSHRTNNIKTSHRSDSREHETKASKRDNRKTMESLFGKTPKPSSPTKELTNEQKAKVHERMLANAEPVTPMEKYTPQSENTTGSEKTNKQQTEKEINKYFHSNVREIEQSTTGATQGESTDQVDCIVNDIAVSKETKPATEIQKKTTRQANENDKATATKTIEKIPVLDLTANEDQSDAESIELLEDASNDIIMIKTPKTTTENEEKITQEAIKRTPEIANKEFEKIPGLDLVNEEYEAVAGSIEQTEDAFNLKSKQQEIIDKLPSPKSIAPADHAKVETIKPNDVTKIKTTGEDADETTRQAIEKTETTKCKAIEQIPGLDLINEDCQARTESIYQPEEKFNNNNANVIEMISDSKLIPQKNQDEVESIEHLEDASNDLNEIKETNSAAKIEDVINRHANEQTQATSIKAIEQIPDLISITEDEIKSNKQLENASNETLTEVQTTNLITKENETEIGSIEQLEEASNNTTKPAAENEDECTEETSNEKEQSKVVDIKHKTKDTAVVIEPTKTEDKHETSCSDKLQDHTSPIIETATEKEDKLTDFEHANQELKKNFNSCDEQTTTCIQFKTPDHTELIEAPAIDNNARPERQTRSASSVQIIEDIRLPVMMEIEDIAETVDRLNSNKEDIVETEHLNLIDSDKETKNIATKVSTEAMQANANNEVELRSNIEVVSTTLTPKPSNVSSIVMYAQPDSTKIDHNEDDPGVEAAESLIIPDEVIAKSLDLSLSFEMDNIELTLEQLHQQSHGDEQPDEATVTSTSMKALKQDLIKILTQSPVQQTPAVNVSPSPAKVKDKAKKTNARLLSERTTPTKNKEQRSPTPERVDKTPLKKRKLNLDDKTEDQVVLQTPPDSAKTASPSPQHVTIDETLNASNSDINNSSSISNSSIVTKRCSLGNSDYQFERINDEVVLRVTRRPRRRRAAPSVPVNDK